MLEAAALCFILLTVVIVVDWLSGFAPEAVPEFLRRKKRMKEYQYTVVYEIQGQAYFHRDTIEASNLQQAKTFMKNHLEKSKWLETQASLIPVRNIQAINFIEVKED
jgi:hypothetical protein